MSPSQASRWHNFRMAIDDSPIEVLRKQFELEDSSKSPVTEIVLKVAAQLAKITRIPSPLQSILQKIHDKIRADGADRIAIMLQTVADVVIEQGQTIDEIRKSQSEEQKKTRDEQAAELIVDGARRAAATRSISRVQRIGVILARVVISPAPIDSDETEEMMRVAAELADEDISYLVNLVRIQGRFLQSKSHVDRYSAYQSWSSGPWGDRVDPKIDSVFHKLESYGLVSAIAPNNTLNVMADIQTRFALLPKGLRFTELTNR
jgi:hypothetical protein